MQDDFDLDGLSIADARAYVARFIASLKEVQRQRSAAASEVQKWKARVKLATDNNKPDLVIAAENRLQEEEQRLARIAAEERDLSFRVIELKRRLANLAEQPRMSVDATALAEQLEGVVGSDQATKEATDDLEAQLALEELRKKMESGE